MNIHSDKNLSIQRIRNGLKHRYHNLLKIVLHNQVLGKFILDIRLIALIQLLLIERNRRNLGVQQARPGIRSILYSCVGMVFNINHLGSVYMIPSNKLSTSYLMEKEVIEWLKQLFSASNSRIEGYVNSGGTESNLFTMWSLRDYMCNKQHVKSCVIVSHLTHYSVLKAARMLNIVIVYTPLNVKTWSIDPIALEHTITHVIERGIHNIMIPITLGYSSTGTCDSLPDINQTIVKMNKHNNEGHCVMWVDAASQGLSLALLSSRVEPFNYKTVYGISVDFHKLGNAPIPGGVLLYRKELRKTIQQKIDYLAEQDVTVSGTRPGFAAMAIWAIIYSRSLHSWQEDFRKAERLKNTFINNFITYFPRKNIIHTPHTLTCALVIDDDFHRLPVLIEQKYDLHLGSVVIDSHKKKLSHYKLHIMPHVSQKVLDELLNDMIRSQKIKFRK